MAEANHRLPQILDQAQARITTAAHMLTQFRARQAVKQQLQRQGLKVSHFAAREITALASEYLAEHRSELMLDAIETITQWTLRGDFGKRAQRALLKSDAQYPGHCSSNEIEELKCRTEGRSMIVGYARVSTEALARRAAGEALVDIARSYNVSHSTISRLEAEA
jgi:hypothetical protein